MRIRVVDCCLYCDKELIVDLKKGFMWTKKRKGIRDLSKTHIVRAQTFKVREVLGVTVCLYQQRKTCEKGLTGNSIYIVHPRGASAVLHSFNQVIMRNYAWVIEARKEIEKKLEAVIEAAKADYILMMEDELSCLKVKRMAKGTKRLIVTANIVKRNKNVDWTIKALLNEYGKIPLTKLFYEYLLPLDFDDVEITFPKEIPKDSKLIVLSFMNPYASTFAARWIVHKGISENVLPMSIFNIYHPSPYD